MANYPGFFSKQPPGPGSPFIRYWPTLIDSKHVSEKIHIHGEEHIVYPTSLEVIEDRIISTINETKIKKQNYTEFQEIPFGRIIGARSGDKGGCANLGVWTKSDDIYSFVYHYLTEEQLKILLPDLNKYEIERYELPNIRSLNFYIKDILEDGASSNTKVDALAKSLGEYLRAKHVNVPKDFINGGDNV